MASENCALNSNGGLKDAKDIIWYNSGDDNTTPIPSVVGKSKARARAPGMFFICSYVRYIINPLRKPQNPSRLLGHQVPLAVGSGR